MNLSLYSASHIADLVKTKKITAQDVAADGLAQVKKYNDNINALVSYDEEEIIKQAKRVDEKLARGEKVGPLAGVLISTKITTDVKGWPTDYGTWIYKDRIAKVHSPLVENLVAADAILFGRTNSPAFASRWFTSNKRYGVTRNPRDPGLTPGGSSGGAAAAVAIGMGHVGMGTDIGGSIRYPAYACGVDGLRTTAGRIPYYNASMPERSIDIQLMAVNGPIARDVMDLELVLKVASQGPRDDPYWVPAPLNYGDTLPRRIAICTNPNGMNTDEQISSHMLSIGNELKRLGWEVIVLEDVPELDGYIKSYATIYINGHYDQHLREVEREGDIGAINSLKYFKELAGELSVDALSDAFIQRMRYRREWSSFFAKNPIVILPSSGRLPFRQDEDLPEIRNLASLVPAQLTQLALPLLGLPGLALCTGREGSVPLGVQIVADRFREDLCLHAGKAIEGVIGDCNKIWGIGE